MTDLLIREYGAGPHLVIALHGGPAAAGDVAPVARELGRRWHVLEPFQRGSGGSRLSVATHIRDLNDVIEERCGACRPVLVGHSWGAMLALAYAAEHAGRVAGVVLIGCGTFTVAARQEFEARLEARLTPGDRAAMADLERTETNPDRRLAALGRLMTRVYGYDVADGEQGPSAIDAAAHEQTWSDMIRLQRNGTYPSAFAAITVPVLMLHGEHDPHPGRSICRDLLPYIPHLEYQELSRCGHAPWLERQAWGEFVDAISTWLARQFQRFDHQE